MEENARLMQGDGDHTTTLIACHQVSLGYDGNRIIRGLSLTINAGDYLFITGENGSGKTTLIKGILRLIKPLEGSIMFAASLNGTGRVRRNETGYLSQQSAAKNDFPAGVSEIVLSGLAGNMGLRPFYTRRDKETVRENMERLGVSALKNRSFRELSGGQQRRVLIARALSASRKLLVLDEPAAGLYAVITTELYELLDKLNKETGVTIITVSHDLEAAQKYAGSRLHLSAGGGYTLNTQ